MMNGMMLVDMIVVYNAMERERETNRSSIKSPIDTTTKWQ